MSTLLTCVVFALVGLAVVRAVLFKGAPVGVMSPTVLFAVGIVATVLVAPELRRSGELRVGEQGAWLVWALLALVPIAAWGRSRWRAAAALADAQAVERARAARLPRRRLPPPAPRPPSAPAP